jgi:hypothetical protein
MNLPRNLWITIRVEFEGEINTSTTAMMSVTSEDPAKLCPDCLKDQILDALLLRTDLGSITVEINEHPYHWTPEGNSERGR